MHFAEFGVVMLFLVGLELQPALLWRRADSGTRRLAGGGYNPGRRHHQFHLGLSWQMALAVGMVLSLSSTAIVLKPSTKGLIKTEGGQSSFSVLLFQDIAVIPMLALLPLLAVKGGSSVTLAANG